jgi:beta-glucanase (GH16 family)
VFTAIWLLPRFNYYGSWPSSGEIDLIESRGNRDLTINGKNVGSEQTSSTLHFGPFWPLNGYEHAHFEKNTAPGKGFDTDFNLFELEWTPGMDSLI